MEYNTIKILVKDEYKKTKYSSWPDAFRCWEICAGSDPGQEKGGLSLLNESVESKALLIDGMQRAGLRMNSGFQKAVMRLFKSTTGKDLTKLKQLLDSGSSYQTCISLFIKIWMTKDAARFSPILPVKLRSFGNQTRNSLQNDKNFESQQREDTHTRNTLHTTAEWA
jgi:hypothetical protein